MRCYFSEDALIKDATPVDNLFIMEYLPRANGSQLSVYLYGLMLARFPSIDQDICEALELASDEVLEAFSYWQSEGLVFIRNTDPLNVEYALPGIRQAPLLIPGKYGSLVNALQSLFAPRMLSASELRRVYDWVEVFHLDEGAVLELASYCHERKGDRVSIKYLDAVASAWAELGVRTITDAREQIETHKALSGGACDILKRWNKSRTPTKDEIALYETWTKQWGFTPEAIQTACKAMINADRPTFAYLNGILERLKAQGAFAENEVSAIMDQENADMTLSKQVFARMGARRQANAAQTAQIKEYSVKNGIELEALCYAAELASCKERPYPYFTRIVKDYIEKGITSLEQAKAVEPPKSSQKNKPSHSMDYPQRPFLAESIDHYFIDLDS